MNKRFDLKDKDFNQMHSLKCVIVLVAVSVLFMLAFIVNFCKIESTSAYADTAVTSDTVSVSTLTALQKAIDDKIYKEIIVENEIVLTDGVIIDGLKASGERTIIRVQVLGTTDQGVVQSSIASDHHVFTVKKDATVTLKNIIIKGGRKTAVINGEMHTTDYGNSTPNNNSKLICENVMISNASNEGGSGGGIHNTKGCTTIMKKCNIVRNSARYGGGFQNQQGLFIMENCSVSENRSFGNGGGGGENTGTKESRDAILYLINTTVANNTSNEIGGGINAKNSIIYILNSTISGNITSHTQILDKKYCGGGIGNNGSYIYAINSLLTNNIDYIGTSVDNKVATPSDIGVYESPDFTNIQGDPARTVLVGCMYGAISGGSPTDGSNNNLQETADEKEIYAKMNQASFIEKDGTSNSKYVFNYPALVSNTDGILTAPITNTSIANNEQVAETYFYYPQDITYSSRSSVYSGYTLTQGGNKIAFTGQYSASVEEGRVDPDYIGAGSPIGDDEKVITIKVLSNNDFTIDGGTVFGDSFIISTMLGKEITLKANQKEGKENYAVVWYDSAGKLLSGTNPYKFNAVDDIVIQPTSFSVTANSASNTVNLNWTSLAGVANYTVYYGEIDLFEQSMISNSYSATSASINNLVQGKTYYFWVVPNSNGIEFNSAKASAAIEGGKIIREAPNNLGKVDQQTIGVNNGEITGVTAEMEYFAENEWKTVGSNKITGLAPGEYPVRYAETQSHFASTSVTITILKKEIINIEIITQPKINAYNCGDTLDLSDLEVKLTYSTKTITRVKYELFKNRGSYDSLSQIKIAVGSFKIEDNKQLTHSDNGSVIIVSCDGKEAQTNPFEVNHYYQERIVEPTCTERGYTFHICACSDEYKDNYTSVTEHRYGEWLYNENNKHIKECLDCGSSIEEECIITSIETDSTCTEGGYTVHTCDVCKNSYKDNVTAPKGHTFGEWEITQATCTKDGKKRRQCSGCNQIEEEVISARHKCSKTERIEPTCTENGNIEYWKCDACNLYFLDDNAKVQSYWSDIVLNKLDHDYGKATYSWSEDYSTCEGARSCSREEEHREIVSATIIEKHIIQRLSCTTDEKVSYIATFNQEGFETQTLDVTTQIANHDYQENFTVDIEPTCTTDGSKSKHCSNCNEKVETTVIEKLGHDYTTEITGPTCTEGGYTAHTCKVCRHHYRDNETKANGHTLEEFITDPTCKKQGYTVHSCSKCDYMYIDTYVDATGHTYVFYDMDGSTVLKYGKVACGYAITAPEVKQERRTGQFVYRFRGWSEEIPSALTQDIQITALYQAIRISGNYDVPIDGKDDKVIIETPKGMDDKIRLVVERILDEGEFIKNDNKLLITDSFRDYSTNYILDIYIEKNEKRSDQLDYTSQIRINIDDIPNFNDDEFVLLKIDNDGNYSKIDYTVVDDYIVFETDIIGSFLIVEQFIDLAYIWWLCLMQAGVLMTLSLYIVRRNKKKQKNKGE